MRKQKSDESKLKVGIVGFGTFGQFLAKRLASKGHKVIATSRTPYEEVARKIGVEFFQDVDDFCEEHPEVVLLASSILSTESVLRNLPVQRLKRNTLFVDVLSVKVFPKQLLLRELPPEVDILCTHPMFGPDSGKGSWAGLNFMYEKVRIGADPRRERRVENFLKFFREEGCTMVEMTCEEHDRQAASTQFITHTVGRVLGTMQLRSTEINTKGFEALLNLVNNTTNDSFELYYGLFLYNQNATDELERLEKAFDTVKKQLFGRLHDIARAQLFPMEEMGKGPSGNGNGNGKAAATAPVPALPAAREPLALPAGKDVYAPSNTGTIDV
ncbi:arogenate/prephenate dehydrogenase [Volvox carteri f. nagariensis]|uniref:Arogenate/prephenate dehydrogenase n=1 Tax=Volvox carteri f. nagariensis TaxID=3068 RepID=D8TIN1_VOLCA|nr:arogenate/prephenate dehydrogenase [Volvox carteri f. nagariensis]EFJ52916.1 arogenate/prephenate dehydrogenase [Volvox carteri f. nagariensis]|eukprot:XP_002945921.1 arogenate/prephenate dehydrogenase [Volvox carteri f. nagariensis]